VVESQGSRVKDWCEQILCIFTSPKRALPGCPYRIPPSKGPGKACRISEGSFRRARSRLPCYTQKIRMEIIGSHDFGLWWKNHFIQRRCASENSCECLGAKTSAPDRRLEIGREGLRDLGFSAPDFAVFFVKQQDWRCGLSVCTVWPSLR
jgi:hypothetical protein